MGPQNVLHGALNGGPEKMKSILHPKIKKRRWESEYGAALGSCALALQRFELGLTQLVSHESPFSVCPWVVPFMSLCVIMCCEQHLFAFPVSIVRRAKSMH
jgi:hypothetical protein